MASAWVFLTGGLFMRDAEKVARIAAIHSNIKGIGAKIVAAEIHKAMLRNKPAD
jgi:hypothetical protein